MLSHLVFSSLLALTLAQQCPVNPGSGSVRYPSLTKKNITIQETLPKGAGIEGWLQVPSRLINAVWGDAGYPYGKTRLHSCAQYECTCVRIRTYARAHIRVYRAGSLVAASMIAGRWFINQHT